MDARIVADGGRSTKGHPKNDLFQLRSYQSEMVAASMDANIIVAMDTGSGKTHIAISRTAAALESCEPTQLVWFLAPTVALCEQQYKVFQKHLPAYQSLVLTGNDNVDHWSDQETWDAVLTNIRIVLTTHKVLADALAHAFVTMSELALLIFDEAHHCVLNHPANQIMTRFYTPVVQRGLSKNLPRILGLSASPVMKASANERALREIERNLHSTTVTPRFHRSELVRFVHRPELIRLAYPVNDACYVPPSLMSLNDAVRQYNFEKDPYILELKERQCQGHDCSKELVKFCTKPSTYCYEQLKTLSRRADDMLEELGASPAGWYLQQCISKQASAMQSADRQLLTLTDDENRHLTNILLSLETAREDEHPCPMTLNRLSPKVEALIDVLTSEAGPNFRALVFVEQRVWVAALAEIILLHPRTKDLFNVGTFVGTSNSLKRKAKIADVTEPRKQQETLESFRTGKLNLILATSVLEEGIDISSCHLVICFEPPKNLKSFIQRRGRARMQQSKYFVFTPDLESSTQAPTNWEALEEDMKKAYMDGMRRVEATQALENLDDGQVLQYEIEKTGALLTSDDALQHLHHFCALLGSGVFVDLRPQFTFHEDKLGNITAEVMLPILVDPAFRCAKSAKSWRSERLAKNDAALEAYKALHKAGLVNDNLMPHRQVDEAAKYFQTADDTPSMIEVSSPFDPWVKVARSTLEDHLMYHRTLLTIEGPNEEVSHLTILTPMGMPRISKIPLYWNQWKVLTGTVSGLPDVFLNDEQLSLLQKITRAIFLSVFAGRMKGGRNDFLCLLVPSSSTQDPWNPGRLQEWHKEMQGRRFPVQRWLLEQPADDWGLVNVQGNQRKYLMRNIDHSDVQTGPILNLTRLPKRRDFLHPVAQSDQGNQVHTRVESFGAAVCEVEDLPARYAILALFVPSFLHVFETYMLADTLRTSILEPVHVEKEDLPVLVRAITSSAASQDDNYQRLEFLGDCILKFIASLHLMAAHLQWPASYLTGKKGKVVSNGFLARATIAAGLDKFIITKRFTGAKWSPPMLDDILSAAKDQKPTKRSSKLLADVIESLIGLAYVTGGFDRALLCTKTLLPLEPWTPIPEANVTLQEAVPDDFVPTNTEVIETLIGYNFTRKTLLLEALTHASYNGPQSNVRSYERLEFLGDAVLDYIITARLYNHKPDLPHQQMHAIRSAMANAAFLAFCMFETKIEEEHIDKTTFEKQTIYRALWQFLRHNTNNYALISSRQAALKRHEESRAQILRALEAESRFPWHIFELNDAPKFLSDIVESVIGAIYIDSQGSIEACELFVRRLGVLDRLERILRGKVDCLHPKERLGHLAVEKKVNYVRMDAEEGSKVYRCQVKVGDEEIGEPAEAIKRSHAETIAAWRACEILEQEIENEINVIVHESADSEDEWHDAEEGGGVELNMEERVPKKHRIA